MVCVCVYSGGLEFEMGFCLWNMYVRVWIGMRRRRKEEMKGKNAVTSYMHDVDDARSVAVVQEGAPRDGPVVTNPYCRNACIFRPTSLQSAHEFFGTYV